MNSWSEPRKWERFFWPILASALLLALWYYSVRWTGTKVFPSPREVEKGLAELLRHHVLWGDIVDSLRRVAAGFGLAVLLGIPLGLTLGWYPAANQVVNPTMQILRPISPIAWIPVAIIFFGVGDRAAMFLIFLGRILSHRGGLHQRSIQCAFRVSAAPGATSGLLRRSSSPESCFPPLCRRSSSGCVSRWGLPGSLSLQRR
jgi:hypothetical protein